MTAYTNAVCVTESDGYHTHEYTYGNQTVVENLHAWMDVHRRNWPGSADHGIRVGQREIPFHGTAVEAWQSLTDDDIPAVDCRHT